jgi:REP element-mobilizing transposase RayT
MNYRDYKQFAEGGYYHIYNRGNNKQDVFKEDADYLLFLSRLRECLFPAANAAKMPIVRASSIAPRRTVLPSGAFELVCYCLMPNHLHLLMKQCGIVPISTLMTKLCTGYSKCFNLKYERVGQVFQDQFKAIEVNSNEYLIWLSAYIHNNPVVAGFTQNPQDWRWSSYGEYFRREQGALCDIGVVRSQFQSFGDYEKFVLDSSELIRERKNVEHMLLD